MQPHLDSDPQALLFVVSNLLVDISYAYFDPRIRYEEKAR
jgi:hypothetical protein